MAPVLDGLQLWAGAALVGPVSCTCELPCIREASWERSIEAPAACSWVDEGPAAGTAEEEGGRGKERSLGAVTVSCQGRELCSPSLLVNLWHATQLNAFCAAAALAAARRAGTARNRSSAGAAPWPQCAPGPEAGGDGREGEKEAGTPPPPPKSAALPRPRSPRAAAPSCSTSPEACPGAPGLPQGPWCGRHAGPGACVGLPERGRRCLFVCGRGRAEDAFVRSCPGDAVGSARSRLVWAACAGPRCAGGVGAKRERRGAEWLRTGGGAAEAGESREGLRRRRNGRPPGWQLPGAAGEEGSLLVARSRPGRQRAPQGLYVSPAAAWWGTAKRLELRKRNGGEQDREASEAAESPGSAESESCGGGQPSDRSYGRGMEESRTEKRLKRQSLPGARRARAAVEESQTIGVAEEEGKREGERNI
ncbi:uncharacterized protein LOC142362457 [Opisthocomus hoazin]|uniref:uncharacterized protein LOC142362457 n=1 Tax=Opisthocomus hoazin TaxID=30419 RepID=UPI003F531F98